MIDLIFLVTTQSFKYTSGFIYCILFAGETVFLEHGIYGIPP